MKRRVALVLLGVALLAALLLTSAEDSAYVCDPAYSESC